MKIPVCDVDEELEKKLEQYKRYNKALNDINDVFIFEDLETRETSIKVATAFIKQFYKHISEVNAKYIFELYCEIEDIVYNKHISWLNKMIDLNTPIISDDFFRDYLVCDLNEKRKTVRDLFVDKKWRNRNPTNELKSIEKIIDFYEKMQIGNKSDILNRICSKIFKCGVAVRNDISTIRSQITIDLKDSDL